MKSEPQNVCKFINRFVCKYNTFCIHIVAGALFYCFVNYNDDADGKAEGMSRVIS